MVNFKSEIKNSYIENVVKAIGFLSDDAKVNINEDGIKVIVVDQANVCMVDILLNKLAFSWYDADELVLGIDIKNLSRLLKSTNNEYIEIEYLEDKSRIKFIQDRLSFSLALINIDTIKKEPKMPQIELPVKVIMNGKSFRDGINAAGKVGDYIAFDVNDEGLKMSSEGNTSEMELEILKDELDVFERTEDVRSMFDLEYLTDISKALGKSDLIELGIGKDYPLKVVSRFKNGEGEIKFLLAPRIED